MKKIPMMEIIAPLASTHVACDVDQTKKTELPEVEVKGDPVPEFDLTTPEVEVGTKKTTIEVPDADVKMPEDAKGAPVTGDE